MNSYSVSRLPQCCATVECESDFDNNRIMETKAALKALAALSQETRLGIFRFLVERGPEGAFAGTIAEELGIAGATLSFHLKEMTHAELLDSTSEGRFVRYKANLAVVQDVVSYLTDNCCAGDPSKCAPIVTPTTKRKSRAVKAAEPKRKTVQRR